MQDTIEQTHPPHVTFWRKVKTLFVKIPLLGWIVGAIVAVLVERLVGSGFASGLGLTKEPALFGLLIILKTPSLIPGALLYVLLIYMLPTVAVAWATALFANRIAALLLKKHILIAVLVHLGLLYVVLHFWADISGYRAHTLKLTLIAIMVTLSLNIINGYMGEFSCSHPGFMALGAYTSSVFTLSLFTDHRFFGSAVLPEALGPFLFPIGLILGGLVAALGALIVAIPSFRTRGDYLAIISLAFMFIVKSMIENMEFVGGPRGLSGQPRWADLTTIFIWTVISIWIINNFVRSTLGKALNAVRDEEMAANSMTVNTRRTKITAFLFAAFWAGVAGGLLAHVLQYVNPSTFGIQKLAEVLAMVYFGGLNSVYGSIVGAVSITVLGEALRPLEIFKWIIIPLILILVMIFRPPGLIAFKEFDVRRILQPRNTPKKEVKDDAA
ncbi:MAG: branched-chain amino acid ABC transporter permease [Desulfobacterales bacterium]|nr:branched-chain amino acid ABC transporter permease [Desulfobacterales bacterium]